MANAHQIHGVQARIKMETRVSYICISVFVNNKLTSKENGFKFCASDPNSRAPKAAVQYLNFVNSLIPITNKIKSY